MSNKKYHTDLKLAVQQGLCPDNLLLQIPKSTIHNIKKQDLSNVYGADFVGFFQEQLELFKELQQMKMLVKTLGAVIKIKNTLLRVKKFFKNNKELAREIIVDTAKKIKDKISLDKILKAFAISKGQFYSWAGHAAGKCLETVIDKCPRVYPGQLTKQETAVIKDICTSEKYQGWSVYSMAMYAIRNGLLYVHPNSWYKYIKALGITLYKAKSRRLKNKIGIRADKPMQILHCDITRFVTLDGTRAYIYLVADNFSRAILSCRVSRKISGAVWKENVINAYNNFVHPELLDDNDIMLVVDGGPENKGDPTVDENGYKKYSLRKVVAGSELLPESNSMIEAVNKVLKYQFLYCQPVADFEALEKRLEIVIERYNKERPHYALKGLTPYEALMGCKLDKYTLKHELTKARIKRIEINRYIRCKNCE